MRAPRWKLWYFNDWRDAGRRMTPMRCVFEKRAWNRTRGPDVSAELAKRHIRLCVATVTSLAPNFCDAQTKNEADSGATLWKSWTEGGKTYWKTPRQPNGDFYQWFVNGHGQGYGIVVHPQGYPGVHWERAYPPGGPPTGSYFPRGSPEAPGPQK